MKKIVKLGVFILLLSVFTGCSGATYLYKTIASDVTGKPKVTHE